MIHFITSIRIIPATPIAIHSLLSTSKSWGQNVEIKPSENQRDLLDLLSPTVRWVSRIQNPRFFSLGFPFKPRFIAGRVGFRVSDGVSGWSQRNLNCVSEAEKIFLEVARTDSLVKELSSWPRGWMWGQHVVHGYGPARWSLGAWGSPIIWHWLPVCFCPKAVDLSELNCSIATCNHH
jgi:hypothetical protein